MNLINHCFSMFPTFMCLCMACYMTYLQFSYYLSNGDLASISYRKFNTEEKDEYPTLTICLSNPTTGSILRNETKTANDSDGYDAYDDRPDDFDDYDDYADYEDYDDYDD